MAEDAYFSGEKYQVIRLVMLDEDIKVFADQK